MEKLKINLKENQKLWFTGCVHGWHKNIAGPKISNWDGGYRNFDSVEKMNEALFSGINNHVGENDILIDLGDQVFEFPERILDYKSMINCKTIHVIQGNHTNSLKKYASVFASYNERIHLQVTYQYKDQKRTVNAICEHYPALSWYGSGKGWWQLHAHVHNAPIIRELNTKCKRFEVSMDHAYWLYGEYRPFELRELVGIQDKKQIEVLDHHDSQCNIK